jgi:small subunit ribosomal protein S8
MVDVFADAINKIKVYESQGMYECTVPSTKLIRAVLDTMKSNSYIKDYEEFKDGKFKSLRITLSKKINDIGVIKPRYPVSTEEMQRYEVRYIPSRDFGILIVSTPEGIMTNRDAKSKRIGGRLIAYVY